ncbi:unnamed protein product [Arabidopsis thaliana]|uniref:PGG domain-containing protein n=1 Tax=Arabidopsis thaliana TaxID=3702 RepID=A0A654FLI4_ARATH|nr:unnamed protein product [Arabidopsis thaliana]
MTRAFHLIIDCITGDTGSIQMLVTNLYDLPGEYVPMNPEIFSAMRAGNVKFLDKMKTNNNTPLACFRNETGDFTLHLAAAWGRLELVKRIVSECPCLLLETNSKDQIPLHAAAAAGRLAVVEAFVARVNEISDGLSEEERERVNLYAMKDIDGNTALHLALKGGHLKTAACLVKANHLASFLANNHGVSPLFTAIIAGSLTLVEAMMYVPGQTCNLASKLEGRKSLVHAALKAKNSDILDVILSEDPSLVNERDEEGRTCLSVAAYVGYYKGVVNLLHRSTSNVFECDDDGSYPIHMAVEKGRVKIFLKLLKCCPDSQYLLNKQGQNILHIAAKSGKTGTYLLQVIKAYDLIKNDLIMEQDVDGNTPLHLATLTWRPRTVNILNKFTLGNHLHIRNKDGLSALDIAESNLQSNYVFRERMTLMVLLCTCSPRGFKMIPTSGITLKSRSEKVAGNKYKDSINVLLLVATLVATVAFAAGIAIPGGFSSSTPKRGIAILDDDDFLSIFLVFNTLAMQSSVLAIVALIWAQLGDPVLVHKTFHLALPALFVSLVSMSSAFFCGVVATTKHNPWLFDSIIFISIIFLFVVAYLLAPYAIPQFPGTPFLQRITKCYLDFMLLFVNEDDVDIVCEKKQETVHLYVAN